MGEAIVLPPLALPFVEDEPTTAKTLADAIKDLGFIDDHTVGDYQPLGATSPIFTTRSTGNLACGVAANTWHDLDQSGSASARDLDLVIPDAYVGQVVTIAPNGASTSTAAHVYIDAWSIVAGARVASWGGGANGGVPGWALIASTYSKVSGSISKILTVNDIEGGACRIRICDYNTTTTARALASNAGFIWRIEGWG